jgi:hypothetical protein
MLGRRPFGSRDPQATELSASLAPVKAVPFRARPGVAGSEPARLPSRGGRSGRRPATPAGGGRPVELVVANLQRVEIELGDERACADHEGAFSLRIDRERRVGAPVHRPLLHEPRTGLVSRPRCAHAPRCRRPRAPSGETPRRSAGRTGGRNAGQSWRFVRVISRGPIHRDEPKRVTRVTGSFAGYKTGTSARPREDTRVHSLGAETG